MTATATTAIVALYPARCYCHRLRLLHITTAAAAGFNNLIGRGSNLSIEIDCRALRIHGLDVTSRQHAFAQATLALTFVSTTTGAS